MHQLKQILNGKIEMRCPDCGQFFYHKKLFVAHKLKGVCTDSIGPNYFNRIFMTFDNEGYFCQLGCMGTFNRDQMVNHHINSHTDEQLLNFSILRQRLRTMNVSLKFKQNKTTSSIINKNGP